MEPKQTLFNYLHDALVQQIVSGRIAYGEKLPSLRSLCGLYHVGIRTVRDVMNTLISEGYVETVQRSHIRVIYKKDINALMQAEEVLMKREMVYALIKTLAYIMPHIYAEAAVFCDTELIQKCRNDIVGIDGKIAKEQWRISRSPFQRIKSVYHNSLLEELCVDFDLSAQVIIVPGFENPYIEMSVDSERGLNYFFDCIASQDYDRIYAFISKMYHTAAKSADTYFKLLESAFPMEKPNQETYHWNAEKGRQRLHMQVTRSIIKKISKGIYKDGSYLPSNSQLCEEYKISSYTVGNVMETLEKIGVVKKMNLRGGYMITSQNARKKELVVDRTTSSLDAKTFLEAIHLLALISKGVADLSFEYITDEILAQLDQKVKARTTMDLSVSIMAVLIHIQPYEPLKVVYNQLEKLVEWGYYFAFTFDEIAIFNPLQGKSENLIKYAIIHDKAAFTESLKDMYYYVFNVMQKLLLDLGITEVSKLKL